MTFTVPGPPVPKGRPRVTRYGTYTPERTAQYEERVRAAWKAAGGGQFPADVPLHVTVTAWFQLPASLSKRGRAAMAGKPHTRQRGDLDNVVKSVLDALNKHAFPDDCAVSSIRAEKRWAEEPLTVVTIHIEEESL